MYTVKSEKIQIPFFPIASIYFVVTAAIAMIIAIFFAKESQGVNLTRLKIFSV